jgi:hypothetical protein
VARSTSTCYYGKGFDHEEDGYGKIFKPIPMSDEMVGLLEEQRQKFIQKYGREPRIFWSTAPAASGPEAAATN